MRQFAIAAVCLASLAAAAPAADVVLPAAVASAKAGDQAPSDSTVHYSYDRHYGYNQGHLGYAPSYGYAAHGHAAHGHHAQEYAHHDVGYGHGHGHVHKHGYETEHHYGHGGHHGGYGHQDVHHGHDYGYHAEPHHHGYVPVYGPEHHDHGHGYAHGHDAVGQFHHHTGPFGPFGFYANFYHDL